MGFSFGKDRGVKLIESRRNNMGQAPPQEAQKWKHQLCDPAQDSIPLPSPEPLTSSTWLYL